MGHFGLGKYEDYIVKTVIGSSFGKDIITTGMTYVLTSILRFHISIGICMFINGTFFKDMIFPVIVTVLLSRSSGVLFRYIETHRSQYQSLVDYCISHYSRENLMIWKRYILLGLVVYINLAIAAVTLDNTFMLICTWQATISFVICDLLENRAKIIRRIKTWMFQPSVTFCTDQANFETRFFEEVRKAPKRSVSPSPVKPPTPPKSSRPMVPEFETIDQSIERLRHEAIR